MVLENIFILLFELIKFFVDTLFTASSAAGGPATLLLSVPDWGIQFLNLLLKGLAFFPFDVWAVVISDAIFMMIIHFGWAVIEWIYIKIPGVN